MTNWSTTEADLRASVLAGRAADAVRRASSGRHDPSELIRVQLGPELDVIEVPALALELFADVLDAIAVGRDVVVAPGDISLGTAETAALLGVSRTWVARVIDSGGLRGFKRGSKRRVQLGDLIRYTKARRSREVADASDETRRAAGSRVIGIAPRVEPKRTRIVEVEETCANSAVWTRMSDFFDFDLAA